MEKVGKRGKSWRCLCECGTEVVYSTSKLQGGYSSCGCQKYGEEVKKKLVLANLGKHHSDGSKLKMSISQTGRKHGPETIAKMSASQTGKHHSEETRKKISESRLALPKPTIQEIKARFEAKMTKNGPEHPTLGRCWQWLASNISGEYGQFRSNQFDSAYAHRTSYELYVGPITDDLLVLHKCDNPSCVNPEHLFLGTQADNVRDMDNKGRRVISDISGNHYAAKLTIEQVRQIRMMASTGTSVETLMNQFNMSNAGISRIISRESWKDAD